MLYPIYDTPTNMLFTQGSTFRQTIVLSQILVLAWRHFSGNDWMAG
ncbi:hypothetical protein ACLB1T_18820 [Escherichia coli]